MSKVKVGPDNVGRLLLAAAKNSERVSVGLARFLVSPHGFFPVVPQLALYELLTAIRVADLVPSQLWADQSAPHHEDFEALSDRWQKARMSLFIALRDHLRSRRPPLASEEVRKAISVFERLPIHSEPILIDLKQLYELLIMREEQYERLGLTRSPWAKEKRNPRRGNRFSEHHQRIVAAIEFLKATHYHKEQDALQILSELLSQYGLKRKPDSLRKLCDRYQSAYSQNKPGCHVPPQNLAAFWFDGRQVVSLGSYLLWLCGAHKMRFGQCLKRISSQALPVL